MPTKSNVPTTSKSPFLVSTKRFTLLGLHPSLDKSGSYKTKITDAGPGSYNPELPKCSFKNGYLWKLKLESENFSKYRGHRNPKLLEEAKFDKTLRGPGTNDVNDYIFKKQRDCVFENIDLGIAKRFVDESSNNPPPDRYFRKPNELSTLFKKSFSKTPTFELDGFLDRFKLGVPSYKLPPNVYEYMAQDGKNTADISKKIVSTRGPYELFTGPRDETTIKNYFAPSSFKPPEYYYVKPSDLDILLNHHSKSKTGKFLKSQRFSRRPTVRHMLKDLSLCYRNPDDPGPARYNLEKFGAITQKSPGMYPFNTSKAIARPPPARWTIFPGPGRYTPKAPRCMKQKRPSWIFLSKDTRMVYKADDYSIFT